MLSLSSILQNFFFFVLYALSRLLLEIRKWHTIHVLSRLVTVGEKFEIFFFRINYKTKNYFFMTQF